MNFIKFVPVFPNFVGKSDQASINSRYAAIKGCVSEM